MTDNAVAVVSAYFDAWRAHDPKALRALLADAATFTGPLGHSDNADEYEQSISRMLAITADIVIKKMVAHDEDVLIWFELHTSVAPPTAVANWSRIDNGKIACVHATFFFEPVHTAVWPDGSVRGDRIAALVEQAVLRGAEQPPLVATSRMDVDEEFILDFDRREAFVEDRQVRFADHVDRLR